MTTYAPRAEPSRASFGLSPSSFLPLALSLGALVLLAAPPTSAAPVLYTDEAAFELALIDIGLLEIQRDDFEDVASAGIVPSPFARVGYAVSPEGGNDLAFESGAGVVAGSRSLRSTNAFGNGRIRFDFDGGVGGAGASLVNAFALEVGGVEIGIGDDLHFWVDGNPRPFPLGTSAPSVVFLGVIDTEATFGEIVVDKADLGSAFVIDEVRLALVVPEPATGTLFGLGLAVLARRPQRR